MNKLLLLLISCLFPAFIFAQIAMKPLYSKGNLSESVGNSYMGSEKNNRAYGSYTKVENEDKKNSVKFENPYILLGGDFALSPNQYFTAGHALANLKITTPSHEIELKLNQTSLNYSQKIDALQFGIRLDRKAYKIKFKNPSTEIKGDITFIDKTIGLTYALDEMINLGATYSPRVAGEDGPFFLGGGERMGFGVGAFINKKINLGFDYFTQAEHEDANESTYIEKRFLSEYVINEGMYAELSYALRRTDKKTYKSKDSEKKASDSKTTGLGFGLVKEKFNLIFAYSLYENAYDDKRNEEGTTFSVNFVLNI